MKLIVYDTMYNRVSHKYEINPIQNLTGGIEIIYQNDREYKTIIEFYGIGSNPIAVKIKMVKNNIYVDDTVRLVFPNDVIVVNGTRMQFNNIYECYSFLSSELVLENL